MTSDVIGTRTCAVPSFHVSIHVLIYTCVESYIGFLSLLEPPVSFRTIASLSSSFSSASRIFLNTSHCEFTFSPCHTSHGASTLQSVPTSYRGSTKNWTPISIELVPTAPNNARTRPGNPEKGNQYLVLVRYTLTTGSSRLLVHQCSCSKKAALLLRTQQCSYRRST